jgi:hypothetical protein
MRLLSTRVFMVFLPPAVIGYGWVAEKHVNVSALCVMLFLCGFLTMYVCSIYLPVCTPYSELLIHVYWHRSIYSSALAYIVDANVGRSSSAVALNSCFRGTLGFIAAEIAVPLQVCTSRLACSS